MTSGEVAVVVPAYNEADRIGKTLISLGMQIGVEANSHPHLVVVDNCSDDGVADTVRELANQCDPFTVHLINEEQRGIGAACNTGFRFAIDELGVTVIARLDADTVPMPMWFNALRTKHANKPQLTLLTGPVVRGFDGDPRVLDSLLLPLATRVGKAIKAARYRTPGMLRFVPGHNMSTTAKAYDAVGGFSTDSSLTDDVEYNLKINQEFGMRAVGRDPNMVVFTSARRIRELGYIGAARYYAHDNVHP